MYKENYYEKEIIKNTNATCFSYYLYIFYRQQTHQQKVYPQKYHPLLPTMMMAAMI